MKQLYKCWGRYLSYPGNQTVLAVVGVIMFLQIVFQAIYQQMTSAILVSSALDLGVVRWELPFTLSRLWDLLLGPVFLLLSWAVQECPLFLVDDEFGYSEDGVTNGIGTLTIISLLAGFVVGAAIGAIYAPIVTVGVFILLFLGLLCLVILKYTRYPVL